MWYRFNGKQIAFTGNNGTLDTDYAASIAARTKVPAGTYAFRHGDWNGPAVTDYDPSLEHINSYGQGAAGGGYVVRAGDTLHGIALGLWGDASLWYKLAEANGLTAAAGLIEGRSLIVPHGVQANQHNASTLKPYDPADTIGDASPTTPKPQKKGGKCGVFGQILLVAIAVAVSVVTYGALTTASTGIIGAILAGGVSGMAGSIASQTVGVATGIQDKFSFKQVAIAGLSSAVTAGLGKFAQLAQKAGAITGVLGDVGKYLGGSGFLNGAARGALGSALTQGIGVAVGLQKKFDFVGVAAAGLAGGVGNLVAGPLKAESLLENRSLANHFANAGVSAANAITNAATRSLVNGTDFGDNLIAALPDIIGSTIGNMMAFGVSGSGKSAAHEAVHGASQIAGGAQAGSHEAAHGSAFSGGNLDSPGVTQAAAQSPIAGEGGGQVGGSGSGGVQSIATSASGLDLSGADGLIPLQDGGTGNIVADFLGLREDANLALWLEDHVTNHDWTLGDAVRNFVNNSSSPDQLFQVAEIAAGFAAADTRLAGNAQFAREILASAKQQIADEIVITGSRDSRSDLSSPAQIMIGAWQRLDRERPGYVSRTIAAGRRERAATEARVNAALREFDRQAIQGMALGPQLGAEAAAGSLLLRGIGSALARVPGMMRWGLTSAQTRIALQTASRAYKDSTVAGHALSKHAGRNPHIWGKVFGDKSGWHDQAMRHIREIIRAPGSFRQATDKGVTFLEKRLGDGRGIRLNRDFTFKGFVD